MPYITQAQRNMLNPAIEALERDIDNLLATEGSLGYATPESIGGICNYIASHIINKFVVEPGEKYSKYERAIGSLMCTALELYRRKIAPYEDLKIEENGDVFS